MIRFAYQPIFRVQVRHDYYRDGNCPDFQLWPSQACQQLLDRYGLRLKMSAHGLTVYAEVEPESDPPRMRNPFEGESLKFSFFMGLKNPYFQGFTDLPAHRLGQDVFYFNNLLEDIDGQGYRYLGDPTANSRVGEPLQLQLSAVYNYPIPNPLSTTTLSLTDGFDNPQTPLPSLNLGPSETVSELQVNLGAVEDLDSGRLEFVHTDPMLPLSERQQSLYYAPGEPLQSVFGVIEIYNDTSAWTADPTLQVPHAYRLVDGELLARDGLGGMFADYAIGFSQRAVTWQYVIVKKPENSSGIDLNNLSLDAQGLATFSGPVVNGNPTVDGRAIFRSDSPIPMQQGSRPLTLLNNGTPLVNLPNPGPGSMLLEDASHYYEMFIYV
jgi:hypothetical protein